ncbi:MAG TPA: electron transfer flavoprotein subunit alpha [Syntrophobacteraceae bacterium]|nr:electron transfer flavoprotein subunit alpha [Syntrophobacteraceae bacterium]
MAKNTKGIEVAEILPDRCIACRICIGECPTAAIELTPDGVAHIDPELCIGCGKCHESCPVDAVKFERKMKRRLAREERGALPEPVGGYDGVAVFIEVAGGAGVQVSWELIGKARELARALNSRVLGFVLGSGVDAVAREAVEYGCDDVYVLDDPRLLQYLPAVYGRALADLCEKVRPEILLMGATHLGRDLAAVVATLLKTGLTADCTGLSIEEETRLLLMTRPTFGGNIMATIFCEHRRPQMSTVRPMVMRPPEKDPRRQGTIHHPPWEPPPMDLPVLVDFIQGVSPGSGIDITRSPALVVAGRGACDPSSFHLIEELAQAVGGTVACSRPVVESGFMPYERQVGQTGRTVAPKLYIGIGVSGAIQHLVAIQGAEKILAVNSDPKAPIFKVADVGIVGNYLEVVPELIAQLKKRTG